MVTWNSLAVDKDASPLHSWLWQERRPITPKLVILEMLPTVLCFYLTAVLAQLPNTRLYRLALLPVTVWLFLNGIAHWDFSDGPESPDTVANNQTPALYMIVSIANAAIWTYLPQIKRLDAPNKTLNDILFNAADLVVNLRGIGWDFASKGLRLPSNPAQKMTRAGFLIHRGVLTFIYYIIYDTCAYIAPALDSGRNTFGSPKGGTLFNPSLPTRFVYLRALAVASSWCGMAIFSMEMIYTIFSLIGVGLARQRPDQWPPLFDWPFYSTSMTDLWGWRWHQTFRTPFIYAGSYPVAAIFGRTGHIIGAFGFSALLHHVALTSMGRGEHYGAMLSFVMYGVGFLLEQLWRKWTGKKPSGVLGWLWTMGWLLIWSLPMMEAWARSGYIGAWLPHAPEPYRPGMLLLPILSAFSAIPQSS